MNYCKDCLFFRPGGYGFGVGVPEYCSHPGIGPHLPNLITGEKVMGYRDLYEQRRDESACGIEGRWFELKPVPIQAAENTAKMAADFAAASNIGQHMLNNVIGKPATPARKWWDIWSDR